MAVVLYKDGEKVLINPDLMPDYLKAGWSKQPLASAPPKPVVSKPAPPPSKQYRYFKIFGGLKLRSYLRKTG